MQADQIKTWDERCEEHPDHEGIVTEAMIRQRMQEEIDDLRALLESKLPREAIEAASEEVEYSAEVTLSESRRKYLAKVVKQLRAML